MSPQMAIVRDGTARRVQNLNDIREFVQRVQNWPDDLFIQALDFVLSLPGSSHLRAANAAAVMPSQIPKWQSGRDLPKMRQRGAIIRSIAWSF